MPLRINDEAPNFNAETTQGPIDFHQWIGDQWAVLFRRRSVAVPTGFHSIRQLRDEIHDAFGIFGTRGKVPLAFFDDDGDLAAEVFVSFLDSARVVI